MRIYDFLLTDDNTIVLFTQQNINERAESIVKYANDFLQKQYEIKLFSCENIKTIDNTEFINDIKNFDYKLGLGCSPIFSKDDYNRHIVYDFTKKISVKSLAKKLSNTYTDIDMNNTTFFIDDIFDIYIVQNNIAAIIDVLDDKYKDFFAEMNIIIS